MRFILWVRKLLGIKERASEPKPVEVAPPPKPTPPPLKKPVEPQAPRKTRVPYKCIQTGKRCYATREYAAAQKDRLAGNTANGYLRIYVCEFCNYWHLTHKKRYKW